MDETYQDYINRVTRLTLPASCSTQLQTIQESPKFAKGKTKPFPGYTIITPPCLDDRQNLGFYHQIERLQQQLIEQLNSDLLVALPLESFHLTLGDLIWEHSYIQAIAENAKFESNLRQRIAESFEQYSQSSMRKGKNVWQLWGIVVRPRAIMTVLVPKDRESYETIIQLRRSIYQNSGLVALGIEQQYNFTAHITLGYFGKIPADLNRDRLCVTISQINDRLVETPPAMIELEQGELRKFDNMLNYYRESDWPVVMLNQ